MTGAQADVATIIPLLTEFEKEHISERQALPEKYLGLSDAEMDLRIAAARATLGTKLVILGHHYQRDEVIKFADHTGDSFGLAGCSMADMVEPEQLETCWEELQQMRVSGIVPVTYINSAASIKSFVGERGGTVCTSSNAMATLKWAFERGERILFMPDQHLGRNTAYKMGIPLDQMVVWNPNEIFGGLDPADVQRAKMILWKGHCSVHERFTAKQIETVRKQNPGIRVIVHPEVPWDVVQASDDSGSTEYILKTVRESAPGSVWAVGTEVHLVNRLANEVAPGKTVISLDQFGCLCSTMFRVSPNHLLWILEELVEGRVHNRIVVPEQQKHWNRVALDRMLSIS